MRIGMVCYPSLGGSGIVATELGQQLALRGHEVHFITYEVPFRLRLEEEGLHFHEVIVNQYDLFKFPDYALTLSVKIAEVAVQHQLDILHVHYAIPHATSAYLAKQLLGTAKPAVITTLHGTDITLVGRDPSFFQIVKFSIERSDGVTAVSQSLKEQTIDSFHLKKEIAVIPNFYVPNPKCAKVCPSLRSKLAPNGEKLIVHASNFRSVKRPLDVVRVFSEVQKKMRCRLILVGAGPHIPELRELVHQLKLEQAVTFAGEVRSIDSYMAVGDLMLLPSSQESFGLAALEAMSYGVPVVATRVGGLPEVVEDGVTGYLTSVGDIETMVQKCLSLLSDSALHQSMSNAAYKRASELFCSSRIVPQYETYYSQILSSRPL